MKISLIGIDAREAAIKGARKLSDLVGSTIGPFGMNALIEKGRRITNDGYTISREFAVAVKDEFEREGALAIHESSARTNDEAGDFTSGTEVLTMKIIDECVKLLPQKGQFTSKKRPSEISAQLKNEKAEVFKKLEKMAKPVKTQEELIKSALVSTEDETLAKLIGEAQWKIGKDGVILAEETAERVSSIEYVKGIKIDNGLGTASIMNNPEKQTLELEDVRIILTSHVIQDLKPLESILNQLKNQRNLKIVLLARGFSTEAIQICMQNIKGGFNLFPLNAPYTNMKEVMKDLEAVTGAKYVDFEDDKLEDLQLKDVGYAAKIVAKRYDAIITGKDNALNAANVQMRLETIKAELKGEVSDFAKRELQRRISQLTNGFAVLKVGADTEKERKRLKDKADDAVNAVRLAYQGGTVKGGGLALKEIADELPEDYLLKRPLTVIYDLIMNSAPEGFIIEDWVRDPLLVLQAGIKYAVETAANFSTLNGIETEENKKVCSCQTAEA